MAGDHRKPVAHEGDYNGKPSLTLQWRDDGKYPFSFGVTKAQLILALLPEIQAFVERHPEGGGGGRNNRPQGPRRQDEPLTDRQDAAPPWTGHPDAMLRAQGRLPRPEGGPPC